MKQRITLRVPIGTDWDAGSRLQVYTDEGTGSIDISAPLLARARQVFPGRSKVAGHGGGLVGNFRYGSLLPALPRNGGYGDHQHGQVACGSGQPYVEITITLAPAFGVWKFGVKVEDAEGNDQSGGLVELSRLVSGLEPRALTALAYSSYDEVNDQFTFAVTD